MANYSLEIRDQNVPAHLDIEKEIEQRKNGLFTFTLRVNNGNIVDFNVTDYIIVQEKYGIIKLLEIERIVINVPKER